MPISAQAERPIKTQLRCIYSGMDRILESKVHLPCFRLLEADEYHECAACRPFKDMASEIEESVSRFKASIRANEAQEKADMESEYMDGMATDRRQSN